MTKRIRQASGENSTSEATSAGFVNPASAKRPLKAVKSPVEVAADTARYEALAKEHGADLSEEGFNEALRKIGAKRM